VSRTAPPDTNRRPADEHKSIIVIGPSPALSPSVRPSVHRPYSLPYTCCTSTGADTVRTPAVHRPYTVYPPTAVHLRTPLSLRTPLVLLYTAVPPYTVVHRQRTPAVHRPWATDVLPGLSIIYTLGFVGSVPVGIGRRNGARASASPRYLPPNGPSTTASDGGPGTAPWSTWPARGTSVVLPAVVPPWVATRPYTLGHSTQ